MFGNFLSLIIDNLICFALHITSGGSFPKPLSAAKEREYFEKVGQGDEKARQILIEHNLRLVAHIAKKYYSSYSDQDDLISIGTIGLIKAIDTFDCSKGGKLSPYASRCIENEVLMFFRAQRKASQDVYISDPIDIDSEGNPLTLLDILSTNDTIADDLDLKVKINRLCEYIDEIEDEREKRIVIMRYGLDGRKPLTQREIAKLENISRSYVSRIEKKALGELKEKFEKVEKPLKK